MNAAEDFSQSPLLLIDDNFDNLKLLKSMLDWAGFTNVRCCTAASEGLDCIKSFRPHLIILDIMMPGMNGFEFLKSVRKSSPVDSLLPILVFTADLTPDTRIRALELGASDFLTKPGDAIEIRLRIRNFLQTRRFYSDLHDRSEILEDIVRQRTLHLDNARKEAVDVLARACEYRDDATGQHSLRVGEMSSSLAIELGLDPDFAESMRLAARLHDVGKIAIPDHILYKPGLLTDEEYSVIKGHVLFGAELFSAKSSPLLQLAGEIALYHHERWDGAGYINGLVGEEIPISARIVTVADAFDAITNDRPYREGRSQTEAWSELLAMSGTQFDPRVVEALRRILTRKAMPQRRAA